MILQPPHAAPWEANREGSVRSADGEVIGYCRYERVGELARMQAAARWWAASPSLAEALLAVLFASHGLAQAARGGKPDDVAAATGELRAAHRQAYEAIASLRDPALRPDVAANAGATEVLATLGRLWR